MLPYASKYLQNKTIGIVGYKYKYKNIGIVKIVKNIGIVQ